MFMKAILALSLLSATTAVAFPTNKAVKFNTPVRAARGRGLEMASPQIEERTATGFVADCSTSYFVYGESTTSAFVPVLDEPTVYVLNLTGADISSSQDPILKVAICGSAGAYTFIDTNKVYCAGGAYKKRKGDCYANFYNANGLSPPVATSRKIYFTSAYAALDTAYSVDLTSGLVGVSVNGQAIQPWIKGSGELVVGYPVGTDPGAGYTQYNLVLSSTKLS